jgi:hypothetical protein
MATASGLSTPDVRVLSGAPDDAELAALVTVLHAAGSPAPEPVARSPWADPVWRPGAPMRARAGAWRLSGLPRL